MIVSCPTCSTHYSHAGEGALEMGRCSRCDTRFPLSGPKRRYVVMPAVPADTPDPLLAAGAAEQIQLDLPAEPTGPPVRDVPAEPFVPDPVELPAPSARERDDAEDEGFFGTGMDDEEALFGIDGDGPVDQVKPAAAPATAVAASTADKRKHPIREAFGVFLLAGLGAAAGFHGSTEFGFEPQNAVAVGLGVGLTLSWAWIRWAERKR